MVSQTIPTQTYPSKKKKALSSCLRGVVLGWGWLISNNYSSVPLFRETAISSARWKPEHLYTTDLLYPCFMGWVKNNMDAALK